MPSPRQLVSTGLFIRTVTDRALMSSQIHRANLLRRLPGFLSAQTQKERGMRLSICLYSFSLLTFQDPALSAPACFY